MASAYDISPPRIIGRSPQPIQGHSIPLKVTLTFEQDKSIVWSLTEDCVLIHYRRPRLRKMRFYTTGPINIWPFTKTKAHSVSALYIEPSIPTADIMLPWSMAEVIAKINISQEIGILIKEIVTPSEQRETRRSLPETTSVQNRLTWYFAGLCDRHIPQIILKRSAFGRQLVIRSEQVYRLVGYYNDFSQDHTLAPARFVLYIRCLSHIWLILNDMILGICFGIFCIENRQHLATSANWWIRSLSVEWIQSMLIWFDNWPAGLKLNTELSKFFVSAMLQFISLWGELLSGIVGRLPGIIMTIGICSSGGLTMAIALISDCVRILTFHLTVCYSMVVILFRHQLLMVVSLFKLFRGKRSNPLRGRVDSWDYDVDQLFLGTILFALVAFILPTVSVYYTFFVAIQIALLVLHVALQSLATCLNHFPLFVLMLRIKDSGRIPGGIVFKFNTVQADRSFIMESIPLSLVGILDQVLQQWMDTAAYFSPRQFATDVIVGKYIFLVPYDIRFL
ncbi:Gpi1-domain-containing protein [Sistotremastrum suecicum HHB10207 ss-3]|uniref:Gpi1-domain-containing protein n=1 Tax=Sistotremastrum suecicum HHB10207 ss-3 TaxID=1314776 RepID=A0A166C2N2_9AGAM|nr:Gpi1-domain-containing protein [Sistotremastrum suecicum HHB10207 ss-3]